MNKPVLDFRGRRCGAHTSIAGGVSRALPRAQSCGFSAAQVFVKSNQQWSAPPLDPSEVQAFITARNESDLFVFGHAGYLINLGSPKEENWQKSLDSLLLETERAEALGLPFLVMHPGSHGGAGEEAGLRRIVAGLDEWASRTSTQRVNIALESTAGAGGHLGYKLEHLDAIITESRCAGRLGICLDTAHLFAAGYPIHEPEGYEAVREEVLQRFGSKRLLAWHLNDTPCLLGSRKDRHQHLGAGRIGLPTFQWIAADAAWLEHPLVLETPKGEAMEEDVENWKRLLPSLRGANSN